MSTLRSFVTLPRWAKISKRLCTLLSKLVIACWIWMIGRRRLRLLRASCRRPGILITILESSPASKTLQLPIFIWVSLRKPNIISIVSWRGRLRPCFQLSRRYRWGSREDGIRGSIRFRLRPMSFSLQWKVAKRANKSCQSIHGNFFRRISRITHCLIKKFWKTWAFYEKRRRSKMISLLTPRASTSYRVAQFQIFRWATSHHPVTSKANLIFCSCPFIKKSWKKNAKK